MYAMTCARPNIAFAVTKLSRFTCNPGPHHWMAIRSIKYLKGTMIYGITYAREPPMLEGYSDASWITNEEDNYSTSGWVFIYGEVPYHGLPRNKHVLLIPLWLLNS